MEETINRIKTSILNLNPTYVGLTALIFSLIVCLLLFMLISNMVKTGQVASIYNRGRQYVENNMKKSRNKSFNYDVLKLYISKSGLGHMTNNKITPVSYMVLKISFAILGLLAGLQENFILGLILMLVGYVILDFILNESNKADNGNMLKDIKAVYDSLRIRTKAGVFITSVLTDSYLIVENKRLKQAFLELASDIIAKNDMETALENFKNKFDNEYINTLVIIIKQSSKTGQAAKMFEDIRGQIEDIEEALVIREKQKIRTEIIIVQVMVYTSIVAVSIFMAFMGLAEGLQF